MPVELYLADGEALADVEAAAAAAAAAAGEPQGVLTGWQ
jgi:hypothetical protein